MDLTIIIPFRKEPPKNLEALYASVGCLADVVLVNDGSGIDYSSLAQEFQCKYIHNEEVKGFTACIDMGIRAAGSSNILFMVANSSLPAKGWGLKVISNLMSKPNTLYSLGSRKLGGKKLPPSRAFNNETLEVFNLAIGDTDSIVPSIDSQGFYTTTRFIKRIGGVRLLKGDYDFGLSLSIRAWLGGGTCMADAHFRMGYEVPQEPIENVLYNIVSTLLMCASEDDIAKILPKVLPEVLQEDIMSRIDINAHSIALFRETNLRNFKGSFETANNINKVYSL